MSEEKKRLGWMVDTDTQERLELVKAGVGRYDRPALRSCLFMDGMKTQTDASRY